MSNTHRLHMDVSRHGGEETDEMVARAIRSLLLDAAEAFDGDPSRILNISVDFHIPDSTDALVTLLATRITDQD